MKRTAWAALVFAAIAIAQKKPVDLCTPPPGGAAPSLPAKLMEGQGRIDFPITTSSKEAQAFFNQGVRLLYAFNHQESRRAFEEAARLDPSLAMAWWGQAMTLSCAMPSASRNAAIMGRCCARW